MKTKIMLSLLFLPSIIGMSQKCLQNETYTTYSNKINCDKHFISTSIFLLQNRYLENKKNLIQNTDLFNVGELHNQISNVQVSRNPVQILITRDDQNAIVRCFLSNTVELIKISTGEIVKSFFISSPQFISLSNDGTKLFVASLTDKPFPPDPPSDDCSSYVIGLSGQSILTTIDLSTSEIIQSDTIHTPFIKKLFLPALDSIIYLQGNEVIEYDLVNSKILRQWAFSEEIFSSEMDKKNKKIFLTVLDSLTHTLLKVIDLTLANVLTCQYYENNETAFSKYIGIDTLSNRIFVQGKLNPFSEVLVFDAITLDQLTPIDSASLIFDCFMVCPTLGSIFIGAEFPYNTKEINYYSLKTKKILPLPIYSDWHTLFLASDSSRIFSFQYGASEDALSIINPANYLDISMYDIKTGCYFQYQVTEQKYECSYTRTFATTKDGRYLISTNSPDNSISILELFPQGIDEMKVSPSVDIYPNPATSKITIANNKKPFKEVTVTIFNVQGVEEIHKNFLNQSYIVLDVSFLSPGIYLVNINTKEGIEVKKLIIH